MIQKLIKSLTDKALSIFSIVIVIGFIIVVICLIDSDSDKRNPETTTAISTITSTTTVTTASIIPDTEKTEETSETTENSTVTEETTTEEKTYRSASRMGTHGSGPARIEITEDDSPCYPTRKTTARTTTSKRTTTKKTTTDPYHAKEFYDAEDFYDEYYDDFFDYYDAEDYWRDHQ